MKEITLGKVIKEHRNGYNMTSKELADSIGKSRSYMSLIENDKEIPTRKVISDIGEALAKAYLGLQPADDIPKEKMIVATSMKNRLFQAGDMKLIVDEHILEDHKTSGQIEKDGDEYILLDYPYYDLSWLLSQDRSDVFFDVDEPFIFENTRLTKQEKKHIHDTVMSLVKTMRNKGE